MGTYEQWTLAPDRLEALQARGRNKMVTLMQGHGGESEPAETVKDEKAMEQVGGLVRQKQDSRVLLAVAALLTGLSIAVPAAIIVFVYPLNRAEIHYTDGMWQGEIWWSYVYTGIALSIGFGLAGLVLAKRSETAAYRTATGQNAKSSPSLATVAKVALSLAILALLLGPSAFVLFGSAAGTAVTIAFGLTGILLAARSKTGAYRVVDGRDVKTSSGRITGAKVALALALLLLLLGPVVLGSVASLTGIALSIGFGIVGIRLAVGSDIAAYRATEASNVKTARRVGAPASLVLPFAVVALILGPWASIPGSDANIGRSLIGVGLVGIAVGVWGVSVSDPAATRRWLLPFAIVAFVLALLGNAHMFLLFGLQHLSL